MSLKVFLLIIALQIVSFMTLEFNVYYQVAMFISITQFVTLYDSIGKTLPLRQLVGTVFCINYLFSPILMYTWLNDYIPEIYSMKGTPEMYFPYAIPAMILFLIGVNIFSDKNDTKLNTERLKQIAVQNPRLPLYLIIVGLGAKFAAPYAPAEAVFIFDSMSYFSFIGFYLTLFNGKRFNVIFLILSYGALILQALISSMFNDLLNMLFYLGFMLAIRYKANDFVKIAGVAVVILAVVFIQAIKFQLRSQVTNSITDLSMIDNVVEKSSANYENRDMNERVGDVILRLDQGWVTSNVIQYHNNGGYKHQDGAHTMIYLTSSILPRALFPDKITVGDPVEFNKYSGHTIRTGTAIGLGILSDGYIDFGDNGIFVVFLFGLTISFFIRLYHRLDDKYPLMKLFIPVGFSYALRADTDTQSAMGSLIKVTFLLWIIMMYLKSQNIIRYRKEDAGLPDVKG